MGSMKKSPKSAARNAAAASAEKFYKVLEGGKSCHGGELTWSLPSDGKPGKWHAVTGAVVVCSNGLHVTRDPVQWWTGRPGCEVYEAECAGDRDDEGGNKVAFRRVRLLRRLSDAELAALRIFTSGNHELSAGTAWASGSASVAAYGSASVAASGSASVAAYGSASVKAYDSASVAAYDSASVAAYGSASVKAYDSASVAAYDSASVKAYDSASVTAYDSASVAAYGSASVTSYYGSPSVTLAHYAVLIDRRNGKPVVTFAPQT